MAHDNHSAMPSNVPADMVAHHKAIWHFFTRFVLWNCLAVAAVLVLLLLIGKVF